MHVQGETIFYNFIFQSVSGSLKNQVCIDEYLCNFRFLSSKCNFIWFFLTHFSTVNLFRIFSMIICKCHCQRQIWMWSSCDGKDVITAVWTWMFWTNICSIFERIMCSLCEYNVLGTHFNVWTSRWMASWLSDSLSHASTAICFFLCIWRWLLS